MVAGQRLVFSWKGFQPALPKRPLGRAQGLRGLALRSTVAPIRCPLCSYPCDYRAGLLLQPLPSLALGPSAGPDAWAIAWFLQASG